jgi:hypothetical protein
MVMSRTRNVRGAIGGAVIVLVLAALVPSALAATTTKPVLVTIAPSSVAAGSSTALEIDITNKANPQSLGSANLTPPTGVSLSGLALSGAGTLSVAGSTIQLRNLNLAPNATVTVSGTATGSCDGGGGAWAVKIKQSNDFNGPPGNDFVLAAGSATSTTVTGSCDLRFTVQPTTAEHGATITGTAGHPAATSVAVGLYSGNDLVTSFDGTVKLSIATGTGSSLGVLSPTSVTSTGVQASGGIATFAGISIDRSAEGYQLFAQVADLGVSTTSQGFDIVDDFVDCGGQPCTGSSSGGGTSGEIQANNNPSYLTVSVLPGSIDCANYTEITGTVSWKTDDQGNQIGTITAGSTLVKKLRPPDQGAAHFQVCYSPDPGKSFVDRTGATITAGQAGLLADCTSTITTNCVFFRNKTGAGSAVVQFTVADGKGRI